MAGSGNQGGPPKGTGTTSPWNTSNPGNSTASDLPIGPQVDPIAPASMPEPAPTAEPDASRSSFGSAAAQFGKDFLRQMYPEFYSGDRAKAKPGGSDFAEELRTDMAKIDKAMEESEKRDQQYRRDVNDLKVRLSATDAILKNNTDLLRQQVMLQTRTLAALKELSASRNQSMIGAGAEATAAAGIMEGILLLGRRVAAPIMLLMSLNDKFNQLQDDFNKYSQDYKDGKIKPDSVIPRPRPPHTETPQNKGDDELGYHEIVPGSPEWIELQKHLHDNVTPAPDIHLQSFRMNEGSGNTPDETVVRLKKLEFEADTLTFESEKFTFRKSGGDSSSHYSGMSAGQYGQAASGIQPASFNPSAPSGAGPGIIPQMGGGGGGFNISSILGMLGGLGGGGLGSLLGGLGKGGLGSLLGGGGGGFNISSILGMLGGLGGGGLGSLLGGLGKGGLGSLLGGGGGGKGGFDLSSLASSPLGQSLMSNPTIAKMLAPYVAKKAAEALPSAKDIGDKAKSYIPDSVKNLFGGSSDKPDATKIAPTGDSTGARKSAEDYLGRTMSDSEYDQLIRATHAEAGRSKNADTQGTEEAMVMASILNRARNNKSTITEELNKPNQFQSVTGTRINPSPSSAFSNGPDDARRASIEGAASEKLKDISHNQTNFTADSRAAYGPGTNYGYHEQMLRNGGSVVGGSVFNTAPPDFAKPKNAYYTGELADDYAEYKKMKEATPAPTAPKTVPPAIGKGADVETDKKKVVPDSYGKPEGLGMQTKKAADIQARAPGLNVNYYSHLYPQLYGDKAQYSPETQARTA